jgi:integrase
LQPEHINGDFIKIIQEKTGKITSIPINWRIRAILDKYNGSPPNVKGISISEFNWVIKRLCEMAGINETILRKETYGNKTVEKFYKKYELVSSNTSRKSFCTNRYFKGIPPKVIMAITGHKTENSFKKYLNLSVDNLMDLYKEQMINS